MTRIALHTHPPSMQTHSPHTFPLTSLPLKKHQESRPTEKEETSPEPTPDAEGEASVAHLLEDPGLELTRKELDSLFDLAEEVSAEDPDRLGCGDGMPTPGARIRDSEVKRVRDPGKGLLRFLQRCGLRRSE